jgi:hypothetical protein
MRRGFRRLPIGARRRNHVAAAKTRRQAEPVRQRCHEACIGVGLVTPQGVVEVRDVERSAKLRRQAVQQVKQTDRIGAAGDGDDKGSGGEQGVLTAIAAN